MEEIFSLKMVPLDNVSASRTFFHLSFTRELEELEDGLLLSASSAPGIEEKSIEEENEDEAAELMPSTPLDPAPDSPSSSPRRFFTPSGSHARMSLALLRSRRTAAREERQRRDRMRVNAAMEEASAQPPEARKPLPNSNQAKPCWSPKPTLHDDKDNHSSPPSQEPTGPGASQESYGDDWVNEIALELLV